MHETLATHSLLLSIVGNLLGLHFKCLKYLCSSSEFSGYNPLATKAMDSRCGPRAITGRLVVDKRK